MKARPELIVTIFNFNLFERRSLSSSIYLNNKEFVSIIRILVTGSISVSKNSNVIGFYAFIYYSFIILYLFYSTSI